MQKQLASAINKRNTVGISDFQYNKVVISFRQVKPKLSVQWQIYTVYIFVVARMLADIVSKFTAVPFFIFGFYSMHYLQSNLRYGLSQV
jgi:hypothetical protein